LVKFVKNITGSFTRGYIKLGHIVGRIGAKRFFIKCIETTHSNHTNTKTRKRWILI